MVKSKVLLRSGTAAIKYLNLMHKRGDKVTKFCLSTAGNCEAMQKWLLTKELYCKIIRNYS